MSLKHLVLILLLSSCIFALDLKNNYTISHLDFNASHIDPYIQNDFIIYRFEKNQHIKAFTSSKLLQNLQDSGLLLEDKSRGIVHINRSSSLDYEPIREKIRAFYRGYYPEIKIKEISFKQNSFIERALGGYELDFKKNAYLYHQSTLQLTSKRNKKRHFLSYELKAYINVFKASHNLNRGTILTPIDLNYKEEEFKRFTSLPVQDNLKVKMRLKKRLAKGKILYLNDMQRLPSVLKGKNVSVRFTSGQVHLEFQATCLEDGHIGDEVNIKRKDGKRLKAKVINTNLVEIQ